MDESRITEAPGLRVLDGDPTTNVRGVISGVKEPKNPVMRSVLKLLSANQKQLEKKSAKPVS